jgi:hypothetical protein
MNKFYTELSARAPDPSGRRGLFIPHEGWLTTGQQFHASHKKGPPWCMDKFYRHIRRETGILMKSGKPVGGKFSFDPENRRARKVSFVKCWAGASSYGTCTRQQMDFANCPAVIRSLPEKPLTPATAAGRKKPGRLLHLKMNPMAARCLLRWEVRHRCRRLTGERNPASPVRRRVY